MAFWKWSKKNPTPAPAPAPGAKAPAHGHGLTTGGPAPAAASVSQRPAGAAPRSGPAALAGIKNVIAIASGKGGVGKSTVATNLAIALKHRGASVGLLDADIYGPSQPGMLGARDAAGTSSAEGMLLPVEKHGIRFVSMGLLMAGNERPLVWRAPMAMQVIHQFLGNVRWGNLDYLVIDLPPGTGDVQLTLAQQASLAGAVIVTTPQEVALGIAKKGLEMFRGLNIPILGIVENMSAFTCKHCGEETAVFKEGGGARLASELGVPFLGSVPLDPEVMMSGDEGVPVLERGASTPAAQSFIHIAAAFDQELRRANHATGSEEPKEFGLDAEGRLRVLWPDGQETLQGAYALRLACACASCIDEKTGKPILDPKRVPLDISLRGVQPVGRYALAMAFSDGHSTGIYPFKKLKAMGVEKTEAFSV